MKKLGEPRWAVPLSTLVALVVVFAGACALAAATGNRVPPVAAAAEMPGAEVAPVAAGPGAFRVPVRAADVLISSPRTLPPALVAEIGGLPGVRHTETFALARLFSQGEPLVSAAVDARSFRAFTAVTTARSQEIWDRVAGGEIVLRRGLRSSLALNGDLAELGTRSGARTAHIAAYAELVPGSDIGAIVNAPWGRRLGMPARNAMLVSASPGTVTGVARRLRRLVGAAGSVQTLGAVSTDPRIAVLAGGSVADVAGSFTYAAHTDGSVTPDQRWVDAYIRTESVPILGRVRCNKAMFAPLRAALGEVAARGLAGTLHRAEYGGCYVPRFIANDPTRGLSMHTWGLAIDLNVPGNLRGTTGTLDPAVVRIFERWGFAWGGRWGYTDPMHFELARVVRAHR